MIVHKCAVGDRPLKPKRTKSNEEGNGDFSCEKFHCRFMVSIMEAER
jgi:hypothetical protein